MKRLFFAIILILVNFHAFSQYREVLFDDSGNPVMVRLFDDGSVENHFLNEESDNSIYSIDTGKETLIIDAGWHGENSQEIYDPFAASEMMSIFDPSPAPNGDFVQKISYTPDGNFIAVINKHSDNLFIYNSNTFEVEQIIDLGRGPMDMKIAGKKAYICCYYEKEIQVVDLNTYTVSSIIELEKNPCQIEISPDNNIAYIGLIDYNNNGAVTAYNIETGTQIFETSGPNIYIESRNGVNGRVGYSFMKFYLSPKGDKIFASMDEHNMTGIFSTLNGDLLQSYSNGDLQGAGFSSSGDTLFCALLGYSDDIFKAYRIDMTSLTVIDSIIASMVFIADFADLCISSDGSKMLSTGDMLSNNYMFFDFTTHQYSTVPSASMKYSNLVLKIEDFDYAVVGNLGYFDIVDMNTGQLIATSTSDIEFGWTGAISPSGDKMFLSDCVTEHTTIGYFGEALHSIDISNPSVIIIDTTLYSGNSYEGDQPNMAYLINDGEKLITSNILSHNISVVDVETGLTDTLIYHKEISGLKIIPQQEQAIIYSDFNDTIRILDLSNYEYIADIEVGEVNELVVSDDGQWAYILDYNSNGIAGTLTKVKLDGSASFIEDQILVNARWSHFWSLSTGVDLWGAVDLTPDGKYFFHLEIDEYEDYYIGIVDVEQMTIVASLPIEAFALFSYAFSDDSRWALPLCWTNSLPIIYIDGENSLISSSFPVSVQCLSAAYNSDDGLFYALQGLDEYHAVDPESGDIVETFYTAGKSQYNIKFDNAGNPLILGAYDLIYKNEFYPMVGISAEMNYFENHDLFVIPVPGPDKIVTFGDISIDIPESLPPLEQKTFGVVPNPATDRIHIISDFRISSIEIIDISGKVLLKEKHNEHNPTVNVSMLKSGLYFVRLVSGDDVMSQKLFIH